MHTCTTTALPEMLSHQAGAVSHSVEDALPVTEELIGAVKLCNLAFVQHQDSANKQTIDGQLVLYSQQLEIKEEYGKFPKALTKFIACLFVCLLKA